MTRRSERRPRLDGPVPRRDPRGERLEAPARARTAVRVDPRAQRQSRDAASGRIRIDRGAPPAAAAAPGAAAAPPSRAAPAPALPIVRVDEPRAIVIAVPDLDRARLTASDRDLIGAARILADANEGAVLVALSERCEDDLGLAGADRVVRFEGLARGAYAPAVMAGALIELLREHHAIHLVLADTATGGGDIGRRVAARLGERPAVRVKALDAQQAVSLADGGRREIVRRPARVLLVEAGCAEPVSDGRHEAREFPARALADPAASPGPRLIDLGAVTVDRSAVPLIEAELIVSAGAGVSDWAAFHRLAAGLGAAEAGSRVACDLGHLPRDRQVGASGAVVEPRAYLAFGISGAPQHLQGIARCERVVAVNADAHAPMIQRADLAIVGDAQQIMPALAALAERKVHRA